MTKFTSSTRDLPQVRDIPVHVAIIMDGNGRWAKQRMLPRAAGHQRGVEKVRKIVKACAMLGVEYLTLFAFSSENWRRPEEEVSLLKQLFMLALDQEVVKLHRNGIRLRVVGDIAPFGEEIVERVAHAEELTAANPSLTLTIAANYGGRWDLLQAMQRMLEAHPQQRDGFREEQISQYLSMAYAPEPDLFIRTGGEQRISNFLLWQLAYTELYFTDTLWPDFDAAALARAIESYQQRERRFGRTSAQVGVARDAAPAKRKLA
jgi:undecaprenyl diphosphate synthase